MGVRVCAVLHSSAWSTDTWCKIIGLILNVCIAVSFFTLPVMMLVTESAEPASCLNKPAASCRQLQHTLGSNTSSVCVGPKLYDPIQIEQYDVEWRDAVDTMTMSATLLFVFVVLYIGGIIVMLGLPLCALKSVPQGDNMEMQQMAAMSSAASCVCLGCLMMTAALPVSIIAFVKQIQFTSKLNDLHDVCDGDTHYGQLRVFKWWYWFSFGLQVVSYTMDGTCNKADPKAEMAAKLAKRRDLETGALRKQGSAAQAHADKNWPMLPNA